MSCAEADEAVRGKLGRAPTVEVNHSLFCEDIERHEAAQAADPPVPLYRQLQLGRRQAGAAVAGVVQGAGAGAGVNNVGPMAVEAITALEALGVRAAEDVARFPAQLTTPRRRWA